MPHSCLFPMRPALSLSCLPPMHLGLPLRWRQRCAACCGLCWPRCQGALRADEVCSRCMLAVKWVGLGNVCWTDSRTPRIRLSRRIAIFTAQKLRLIAPV